MIKDFIFKKGASAILLDEGGRVLLGKRAGGLEVGKWALIGGKPEEKETMEEAVRREVREEIALDFTPVFYRAFQGVDESKGVKWQASFFWGKVKGDKLPVIADKNEIAELKFFSQEELANLEIAFNHKEVLMAFFKDYPRINKD